MPGRLGLVVRITQIRRPACHGHSDTCPVLELSRTVECLTQIPVNVHTLTGNLNISEGTVRQQLYTRSPGTSISQKAQFDSSCTHANQEPQYLKRHSSTAAVHTLTRNLSISEGTVRQQLSCRWTEEQQHAGVALLVAIPSAADLANNSVFINTVSSVLLSGCHRWMLASINLSLRNLETGVQSSHCETVLHNAGGHRSGLADPLP